MMIGEVGLEKIDLTQLSRIWRSMVAQNVRLLAVLFENQAIEPLVNQKVQKW